jgi:hypothetical protein
LLAPRLNSILFTEFISNTLDYPAFNISLYKEVKYPLLEPNDDYLTLFSRKQQVETVQTTFARLSTAPKFQLLVGWVKHFYEKVREALFPPPQRISD